MDNKKKPLLSKKMEEWINKILETKKQYEAIYSVRYEDLVKVMADGCLINWINIDLFNRLHNEIQELISKRATDYKKNNNNQLYDNIYYEDIIRKIIGQNAIEEEISLKPYNEASEYIKIIIDNITDEEINNYIIEDKEKNIPKKLIKRLQ